MKRFIVDASVTIAWALAKVDAASDRALELLADGEALVPSVWPLELANALLVAERRKRLRESDTARVIELVMALPIRVVTEPPARVVSTVLALARRHCLSVYDASYLDLAMRENLPLATLDKALRRAAEEVGVAAV